jgi:hypothetical protein
MIGVIVPVRQYKPSPKSSYTGGMRLTGFIVMIVACGYCAVAEGTEVYHWVDENGVSHFTQSAPSGEVSGVKKMTVEDTAPPGYDPDEDRYGVAQQQERMAALRDEMKEKREAELKRQRDAAARQPQVRYVDRYSTPSFWNYPYYRPQPPRPQPPIAVPYETATLRPPGSGRN